VTSRLNRWPMPAMAVALLLFASCAAHQASTPPEPQQEPRYEGRSLSYWMQQLQVPDAKARVGAASALARLGPKAAPAVPLLIEALNDQNKLVRTQSIAALGKIGPAAAAAVPVLTPLLRDDDWATRSLATSALLAIEQKPPPDDVSAERTPARSKARRRPQPAS